MATTSIWSVKGWLGKVAIYVENPEKTTDPKSADVKGIKQSGKVMEDPGMQDLSDVIAYAVQEEKTRYRERGKPASQNGMDMENEIADEGEPVLQQYVSGINCTPSTARFEMLAVKKRFGKDEGIMAFHGYQSFAPGECTPAMAHEIGRKLAEQEDRPTYRSMVREDIDEAIAKARTEKSNNKWMKGIETEEKSNHAGREGKLKRIIFVRVQGSSKRARKIGGLRGLYLHYCYELGILPKNRPPINTKQLHFLLREDLRKLDTISKETRLLCRYHIDTAEQLFSFKETLEEQMQDLSDTRKHLRYQIRSIKDEDKRTEVKAEISKLTKELGELRREVVLCDGIAARSGVIKEKLKAVRQETTERKEEKNHEHVRRGR